MLYGRGAGALPTGSAIVGDIIYCATHSNYQYSTFKNTEDAAPGTKFIENFESAYYIRMNATDKPGVLAKVSSVFAKCKISVAQMSQEREPVGEDGTVPLIFITHVTREHNVKKAVQMISESQEVAKIAAVIRVVS